MTYLNIHHLPAAIVIAFIVIGGVMLFGGVA